MLFLGTSCNAYQKTLNNPDTSVKYKAAEAYYNAGEYRRANRLFEQILPVETSGPARYLFLCEHLSSNKRLLPSSLPIRGLSSLFLK